MLRRWLKSANSKRGLLFFLLLVLLLEAIFAWWAVAHVVNSMRAEFLSQARLIIRAINPRTVANLSGTASDTKTPEYTRLKEQLIVTQNIYPHITRLTLIGMKEDESLFYYLDSTSVTLESEVISGRGFSASSDEVRKAYETGSALIARQNQPGGGSSVSAFVSITQPRTGEPIAVLRVDTDSRDWNNQLIGAILIPVGSTAILALIILGGFSYLVRRDQLVGDNPSNRISLHFEAVITLLAGVTVVLSAAYTLHQNELYGRRMAFVQLASSEASLTIDALRDISEYQLDGLAQFFESSQHVEREEFRQYTSYLIDDPVLQAMAWAPAIITNRTGAQEEWPHQEGLHDLSVWRWENGRSEISGEVYDMIFPILYIEPFLDNTDLLGFDLASEEPLSLAMNAAFLSGLSSASDPVQMDWLDCASGNLFVFKPIFSESFHEEIVGFAIAVIRPGNLLFHHARSVTGDQGVVLGLYQVSERDKYIFLASTSSDCASVQQEEPSLVHLDDSPVLVLPASAFGRVFVIVAHPSTEFSSLYPVSGGWYALLFGMTIVGSLSFVVDSLSNRRRQLELLVNERTVELKKSETRWLFALEGAGDGVWDWNLRTNEMFYSVQWKRMIGYEDDEIGSDHQEWVTRIHPEDRDRCLADVQSIVLGKTSSYRNEHRIRCKDGSYKWILARGKVVEWTDDGNPKRIIGTHTDITERKQAEDALSESMEKLTHITESSINALAAAVDLRDPYTAGHQRRVAQLSVAIASSMNLDLDRVSTLKLAALVHDVGKIQVPAEILNRPGKLGDLEMQRIREHPEAGKELFKNVEFAWPMADMIYQHHERLDGSGYPQGLTDDEILFEAKILAVADVVEAMSSHRPYRQALGIEAALHEIEENAGTLYDEEVVRICLRLFKEEGFTLDD